VAKGEKAGNEQPAENRDLIEDQPERQEADQDDEAEGDDDIRELQPVACFWPDPWKFASVHCVPQFLNAQRAEEGRHFEPRNPMMNVPGMPSAPRTPPVVFATGTPDG
jgi:hypothetical protein